MSEVVLGVHVSAPCDGSFTADGNAALVVAGVPVVAVAQERVTRRKYDGGFAEAARYCLDAAGLTITDVDVVAVSTFGRPDTSAAPENAAAAAQVERVLGRGPRIEVIASHHISHAASAAAQCPYDRALVAVIDNEGSVIGRRTAAPLWAQALERTSYYLLDGDDLRLVARDHADPAEVGYGKTYSKVTRYVGFAGYQESGKTMALAAFGDPRRYERIPLFRPDAHGRVRTALRNSPDGLADLARVFADHGDPLPPPRSSPDERFDPAHLDLAAWCQAQLEESVAGRIAGLVAEHEVTAVCGAGGVFLNSVMNRSLQVRLQTPHVFVPPSPADAGLALGAAAWFLWRSTGVRPRWEPNPYLGTPYDTPTVTAALDGGGLTVRREADPVGAAVADLNAGRVVGWFHGASEYGPRALGNRSILASPADPWARELLNNRVKHREWFRPYAPVSVESRADELYDLLAPAPFMMHVSPVRTSRVREIPGGVHVDGSARLQTVSPTQNPTFHELVDRFTRCGRVPAVLNTSLNVDGMPIVESPADAVECFRQAPGMNALHIDGYRVTRTGPEA